MRRTWGFLGLLLGFLGVPNLLLGVPPSIRTQGVPDLPAGIERRVSPYLHYRVSTFQDWNPDRRDVLLTALHGGTMQLQSVTLPRAAPRPLTASPEPVAAGWFHPHDGSRVLYLSDSGGGEFQQLFLLDRTRDTVLRLTGGHARYSDPRWSPSGRQIALTSTLRHGRDTDLGILDPARPGSWRRVLEATGRGWSVQDWSPDERQWLVVEFASMEESRLQVVDVSTGHRRDVSPPGTGSVFHAGARFLPEGRTALIAATLGSSFRRLAVLDLATRAWKPLGPTWDGDVDAFDLSPDGQRVAVLVNVEGRSELHLIEVATGRELPGVSLPMGTAQGIRWHSNGRDVAFTLSTPQSPAGVYSVDTRRRTRTAWTTPGLPTGRSIPVQDPEMIRIRGFDGLPLSGLLYRPDPKRFKGPRPVLVMLHGGPELQARPEFQGRWNYLLEEMGIALLQPNVRGSSGFGTAFLALDNGPYRGDATKDVGSFLEWIGHEPGLDAHRIGIHGVSYGGYLALAALAEYGKSLRCGIDVAGMADLTSFLENTADYRRDLRRSEYGDEREPATRARLDALSPLGHVDRIRCPLLVAHGANDPRVPLMQAERLVTALRSQGLF